MKRQAIRFVATLASIGLPAMLLVLYLVSSSLAQDDSLFNSSVPTPLPVEPTVVPSTESQVALHYVAGRYGIPLGNLVVVNEHPQEYAKLKRSCRAFSLLDTVGDRVFRLLVDSTDQSVVEDVAAIRQAEANAHREQYGKLEPALYERLASAAHDELIEVAIWIAGRPQQTQEEMFAELAARFPEARAAMDQMGKPFDVQDDELRAEIRQAYSAMLSTSTKPLAQPVVDLVQAHGYAFETYDGLPSITARLPKDFILSLAERPDVGQIYLIEGEGSLLLDSAIPTERAPTVWQRGYDGIGVSVAVVESDNVDFGSASAECLPGTSNCFRNPGQTRPGVLSWGKGVQRGMRWSDRSVDYWSRSYQRLIVAAAGNQPQCGLYLCSPAKGWNVLAVGAYDDINNPYWSNDVMLSFSSYMNPNVDQDREKPEVVAPGNDITGIGRYAALVTYPGTSFSSPQVAGLAALLIDRHQGLELWPEASRAIIMASAVHNIEGPSGIPTGPDLKDGAGGIDAALADTVAKTQSTSSTTPCSDPCWWGIPHNNTSFPVGTWLYRYFRATRGEHVRVAISWWSNADCEDQANCFYDRLDTNLDLGVKDPDDQWVDGAWSASWDNNYELVEFTAPKTGVYKVSVLKEQDLEDGDGQPDYFGLAWAKQGIYLPDIRFSYNGWESNILVRNDSAEPRHVKVSLFFSHGGLASETEYQNMPPGEFWVFTPPNNNFLGSAIVNGSEDVSVAVRTLGNSQSLAYSGLVQNSALGFQASNLLFLPAYLNGFYGWNSEIYITNVGTNATTAGVRYYDNAGTQTGSDNRLLQPNASVVVTPPPGSASLGGVRIKATSTSDRLAASATIYHGGLGRQDAYSAVNVGAHDIYLPSVFRAYYGWECSINLLNTENTDATSCTITFYNPNGSDAGTLSCLPLNGYGSQTVALSGLPVNPGWAGSAHIHADKNLVAAVFQEQSTNNDWQAYRGFKSGASSLYVPWVQSDDGWASSLTVMNVGCSSTTATVSFYDANGSWLPNDDLTQGLNQYGSHEFYTGIPASARSAFISTSPSCPIVANLNAITGSVSDGGVSYSTVD